MGGGGGGNGGKDGGGLGRYMQSVMSHRHEVMVSVTVHRFSAPALVSPPVHIRVGHWHWLADRTDWQPVARAWIAGGGTGTRARAAE